MTVGSVGLQHEGECRLRARSDNQDRASDCPLQRVRDWYQTILTVGLNGAARGDHGLEGIAAASLMTTGVIRIGSARTVIGCL